MHDVRCPEESALVTYAMKQVVAKLVAEKKQDPGPPLEADREEREVMQPGEKNELEGFGEKVEEDIPESHGDTGGRILDFVNFTPHDGAGEGLREEQRQESGNRQG